MRLLYNVGEGRVSIYFLADLKEPMDKLYVHDLSIHSLHSALLQLQDAIEFTDHSSSVAEDIIREVLPTQQLDAESSRIIDEIHQRIEQLQARGLSLRTIRDALQQYQHISPIHVTADYRIILPDYGDMEVRMTPLPKALYLLFLHHPEGICLKCLSDHTQELLHIYQSLTPGYNPARRERSIRILVDPTSNSANEKIAIINRSFALLLDETLLPHYCVCGTKGEAYGVSTNHNKP